MTSYQLTFNNGKSFGQDFEALHDCDTCPEPHLEDILSQLYAKLGEHFGCNFVAISMEKGTHVHIHAYVQLAFLVRTMAAWQKMFPGVHVETCRGTPRQNMEYLSKTGKWLDDDKHGTLKWGPFSIGEMLNSSRGSPEDYVHMLSAGQTFVQVLKEYPDAIRYSYGIIQFEERMKGHGCSSER